MICVHEKDIGPGLPQNNGIAVLAPIQCEVSETINGELQLTLEHPFDAEGKHAEILEDRVITAPTYRGVQAFRIYKAGKDMMTGRLQALARHITYDTAEPLIVHKAPTEATADQALQVALEDTGFSGASDVPGTDSVRWVRKNPLAAIMGTEDNSILSRWGGEVERDNWTFNVRRQLGADNGVIIRYGKNLTGLDAETDISAVKTRILPTGLDADGQTIVQLPELYVDSPNIGKYARIREVHLHYGDIKLGEEEYPTLEAAYAALRAAAEGEFDAGLDKPSISMDVHFVDLSKTVEYSEYQVLETVSIGDTVTIYHEKMGVEASARVVSGRWDCIREKWVSLTLGQVRHNITSIIQNITSRLNETIAREADTGKLQEIVQQFTDALMNPGTSHIRFLPDHLNPQELVAMDTEDPATAIRVVRLNKNGLGVSNQGINGPYTNAMTGDGILGTAVYTPVLFSKVLSNPDVSGTFRVLIGLMNRIWEGAVGLQIMLDGALVGTIGGGGSYGGQGRLALHAPLDIYWSIDGPGPGGAKTLTLTGLLDELNAYSNDISEAYGLIFDLERRVEALEDAGLG